MKGFNELCLRVSIQWLASNSYKYLPQNLSQFSVFAEVVFGNNTLNSYFD